MIDLINQDIANQIKDMDFIQLSTLSNDLRERIVEVVEKNGGHLSSNLGIVETTVALHKVFSFPSDKLIFDVGHQCYAHKILSGRGRQFDSIRMENGLSGFPDAQESESDAFTCGHAGTSISAGLGYCMARDLQGHDYTVINVVGDGAFANGLNLEALTSSTAKPKNFIVILNDNGMSISKNGNGFYRLISKQTTKKGYVKSKGAIKKIFGKTFITSWLARFRDFIKRMLNKNSYMERFGFKYVGVVNGNDLKGMVKILQRVKIAAKNKAVLLHVKTTKGKGLKQAEERADLYHGVGKNFELNNGSFANTLGQTLNEIIQKDSKVVAITCAMKDGTGLDAVEKKFPKNFIDVGIAEEYAVTLSAGMAAGGLKPVVAIYSTFLQRAYDQILHDVCLQNLPVVFCIDRAGFVGEDGKTHQGLFDLSYLSHLPNLTILAPSSPSQLKGALSYALSLNGPVAIRYPKNCNLKGAQSESFNGKWNKLLDGKDITLLSVGPKMQEIALQFAKGKDGRVGVIDACTVKPLDIKALTSISHTTVVTLEENSIIGGFGSAVNNFYALNGYSVKVLCLGAKDQFVAHGSIDSQIDKNGISVQELEKLLNL